MCGRRPPHDSASGGARNVISFADSILIWCALSSITAEPPRAVGASIGNLLVAGRCAIRVGRTGESSLGISLRANGVSHGPLEPWLQDQERNGSVRRFLQRRELRGCVTRGVLHL